jgi:hypothetical protein
VRGQVVQHDVRVQIAGHGGVDLLEEREHVGRGVPLAEVSVDLAGGHVHRRERVDGAVGLVDLHDLGVRTVVIPRKGKHGNSRQTRERRPAFVSGEPGAKLASAPSNGRTAHPLDHLDGTRIWTGHGVLAHNLVKMATQAG